ncbi:alkylmercury lyase family protein [Kribbella sp. CA-294648]|uniref:alkylmercury lyase family protein n=1 Tax=Kribbella sp. CA-294648 TaxID=3239948 RepID=UPI003D944061
MCAIDTLGIAHARRDTRIESVDVTTGQPVTVTTSGRTTWQPATAVVFIGADSGGGPSADCCCDYLTFFADHATAQTWTSSHPGIPGQILNQPEAEQLATRHPPVPATPRDLPAGRVMAGADPPQQPPNDRPFVPPRADHPLTHTSDGGTRPRGP